MCAGGTGGSGDPSAWRAPSTRFARAPALVRAIAAQRIGRAPSRSAAGYDTPMDLPATFDGHPGVTDTRGRALRDLRISVTDRCNFRCTYCMPKEVFGRDYAFLPRDQVLSFEEIERVARVFVGLGVHKLRITGGEPLVRRDLPNLIAMLAAIRAAGRRARRPHADHERLGAPVARGAAGDAGLRRVTVSLDSLDDAVFGAMNGIDFPVERVLDGIDAAIEAGLTPVKVNMVVRRGDQRGEPRADGGLGARDRRDAAVHRVHGRRPLERLATRRGRPGRGHHRDADRPLAGRARPTRPIAARSPTAGSTQDGRGEFGVITSVTTPFCGDCTRARLSAEGQLYTCLFAVDGHDVRARLRDGSSDAELTDVRRADLAPPWRPLLGAPVGLDLDPAEGRDVRDGRLRERSRAHRPAGSSTACPQRRRNFVDTDGRPRAELGG